MCGLMECSGVEACIQMGAWEEVIGWQLETRYSEYIMSYSIQRWVD